MNWNLEHQVWPHIIQHGTLAQSTTTESLDVNQTSGITFATPPNKEHQNDVFKKCWTNLNTLSDLHWSNIWIKPMFLFHIANNNFPCPVLWKGICNTQTSFFGWKYQETTVTLLLTGYFN